MAKELHKTLVLFFVELKRCDGKWQEFLTDAERPAQALKNKCEQLNAVLSDEAASAELCKVDDLREKLAYKINMAIQDELVILQEILQKMNNTNQELKNKLDKLEKARNNVTKEDSGMEELQRGSASRPKLDLLMEWAIDAHKYYRTLFHKINGTVKAFSVKDSSEISNGFVRDKNDYEKVKRILAFTQYLAEEQL